MPVPRLRTLIPRLLRFTALAVVLLTPWAALLFGMAVMSISWLFFPAVPVVLVVALFVHAGPFGPGGWTQRPPI